MKKMKIMNIFLLSSLLCVLAVPLASAYTGVYQNITADQLLKVDAENQDINLACSAVNPLNCGN